MTAYPTAPQNKGVDEVTGLNEDHVANDSNLLVDALGHIIRICENSRSGSRRLRWIIQRAQWALNGKPYNRDEFSLLPTGKSYRQMQDELRALSARYGFCRNGDLDLLKKYADEANELPKGEEFDRIVDLSIAEAKILGEQS